MQRKFVRAIETIPPNFYSKFRDWLNINFEIRNEDTWKVVLEEDLQIDYAIVGSGITVPQEEGHQLGIVGQEVEVGYTSDDGEVS